MTRTEIPQDVRRFILTSVPSVPFLEAVLLLRAEPDRSWDAAAVARRLYLPEARARELLGALTSAGIAQADAELGTACRWNPSTPELAGMIDQLALHYQRNLLGVTDLIHSGVDKKAQQFADAFRWRKDN